MPAGEGIYSMQRVGGSDAAGVYDQMEDQKAAGIPPSWMTYISVDDVDATTAKVVPAGGSVMAEAFDVMDVGRMSMIGANRSCACTLTGQGPGALTSR